MGAQIILQPSGLLALFSSNTDTVIAWDLTPQQVEAYFLEHAVASCLRDVRGKLDAVLAGKPRHAYAQFAMTWDEAVETSQEHGYDPTADDEAQEEEPDGLEMLARASHAHYGGVHPDSAWGIDDGRGPWERAGAGERTAFRRQVRELAAEASVVVVRVARDAR